MRATTCRPSRRLVVLTTALSALVAASVVPAAARPAEPRGPGSGSSGGVTTEQECATGSHNGVAYHASGQVEACVGAGGTALLYGAGTPTCGWLTVAGQDLAANDPNRCPEAAAWTERYERRHLPVTSPLDGVTLDGQVWLPKGTRAPLPIVLWVSPYFGSFRGNLDSPALLAGWGQKLLDEGYGFAVYSVRGTGTSGGCFDFYGKREQTDQAAVVEALARQPFSDGAIGMFGLSYESATAWEAAVAVPKALRAIVVAGNVTDPYGYVSGPQGAARTLGARYGTGTPLPFFPQAGFMARHGLLPTTAAQADPLANASSYAGTRDDRLCPEVADMPSARRTRASPTTGTGSSGGSAGWRTGSRTSARLSC